MLSPAPQLTMFRLQELLCATATWPLVTTGSRLSSGARLLHPGSTTAVCVTWGKSLPLAAYRGLLPWKVGVIRTTMPMGCLEGCTQLVLSEGLSWAWV